MSVFCKPNGWSKCIITFISLGKKKIKGIKSYPSSGMFWLYKFVKLDKILELYFLSDPIEIVLLFVTEISLLFSPFVPSS